MTLALLFPGQGVQHAGMLPWLDAEPLAAPVLEAMAARLGEDWRARLADEAWASSNVVAQQLMVGVGLAVWSVLAPRLPQPNVVAGYSVGELAACSAAGVFDAPTALRLAAQRADLMDRCAGDEPGGLLSVIGVSAKAIDVLCVQFGVAVAIRINADRCVIGGPLAALEAVALECIAQGGEVTPLRVRLASHTPAMATAAREFAVLIETMTWSRSHCVIACDLDGAGRRDALPLKQALARQMDNPVEWGRCMRTVAERLPRCVLEVGPGSSLARMWAAAHPGIPARSIDEFRSAQGAVDWVLDLLESHHH